MLRLNVASLPGSPRDRASGGWLVVSLLPMVGGTDRAAQGLIAALCKSGVEAVLYAATRRVPTGQRDRWRAWHREAGVDPLSAPAALDGRGPRRLPALVRWYRRRPESVVDLHIPTLTGIGVVDVIAPRLAGKRTLVSVHHPQPWGRLSAIRRVSVLAVAALSNAVVADTPQLRDHHAGVLPDWLLRRRARVIPLAVEPRASAVDQGEARRRLGLDPSATVVATVSRLADGKGLIETAHALEACGREDLVYCIAGDGPLRRSLEREELGLELVLLGAVPSVDDVYAAADLHVLASDDEGFGLVHLEAAMHSTPSVGCTVGGVPYAIADEVTGFLVPPGDDHALRQVLDRLLADPGLRRRMGDAARSRAESLFAPGVHAARYIRAAGQASAPADRNPPPDTHDAIPSGGE